jgi:hypothetical protein
MSSISIGVGGGGGELKIAQRNSAKAGETVQIGPVKSAWAFGWWGQTEELFFPRLNKQQNWKG